MGSSYRLAAASHLLFSLQCPFRFLTRLTKHTLGTNDPRTAELRLQSSQNGDKTVVRLAARPVDDELAT